MLEIKNLQVSLAEEDKEILKGVDLTVEAGKVHAIMDRMGQANQHCPTYCQAKMDTRLRVVQPALMVKTCLSWNQKSVQQQACSWRSNILLKSRVWGT